jgi:Flp pilus assembly protein TadB
VTEGQVSNRLFVSHIPTADDLVSQQQAPQQVKPPRTVVPTSTGTADPHPNLVYVFRTPRCVLAFFSLVLSVAVIVAFLFLVFIVVVVVVVRLVLVDNNQTLL